MEENTEYMTPAKARQAAMERRVAEDFPNFYANGVTRNWACASMARLYVSRPDKYPGFPTTADGVRNILKRLGVYPDKD